MAEDVRIPDGEWPALVRTTGGNDGDGIANIDLIITFPGGRREVPLGPHQVKKYIDPRSKFTPPAPKDEPVDGGEVTGGNVTGNKG